MGIRDVNRLLKSNRLLFDVRRDKELREKFFVDMEAVMDEYKLTEVEKEAWRKKDLGTLADLGVHPYMLPQFSRLFYGSSYNANDSEAAQRYREAIIDRK